MNWKGTARAQKKPGEEGTQEAHAEAEEAGDAEVADSAVRIWPRAKWSRSFWR
jgi:hypothetical protein